MNRQKSINVNSADFFANEYEHYRWMRENAPVHPGRIGWFMNMMMVSRYDDAAAMLKDKRFLRNRSTVTGGSRFPVPMPKTFNLMAQSMIIEDEPGHRRLRNLVHKAFTPRMIAKMDASIDKWCHELLDKAEKEEQVNLFTAYALPIPITVISEMLGVPEEARGEFIEWSRIFGGTFKPRELLGMYFGVRSIVRFMRELIEKRRTEPGDDILTALIEAEEEGERLSEDELVSMSLLLLAAGFETTTNLIANGVRTLLEHPEQLALLREQPEHIDTTVEEILRYTNPVAGTKPNYASEDLEIAGIEIPKGTLVMPLIGSANRDESVFDNADTFDITRTPNRHLGFGNGIHYCLGAPLARLEGKIALNTIINRYPNLRLAVEPSALSYIQRPFTHRLTALPVALN
ncbi:MAG: cytochrome P450 [Chloroflexota bacterium]